MSSNFYDSFIEDHATGRVNLATDQLRLLLATAVYRPDAQSHRRRSDIKGEVVGDGYTPGGKPLTGQKLERAGPGLYVFLAATVVWPESVIRARWAVLYKARGPAAEDELIAYFDFGADQSSVGGPFAATWDNGVVFELAALGG